VKTVDEYLAAVSSDAQRECLARLRKAIRAEIPDAEEVISYGIPTYKHHGMVASFAAFKNHCSFFPGHTVRDFEKELQNYKIAKGTVQFTPEKPIPERLVRAMVRARYDENAKAHQ